MSTGDTDQQHGHSSDGIGAGSPKLKDHDRFALDRVSTDHSKKRFLKRWFRKLFSVLFSCCYCRCCFRTDSAAGFSMGRRRHGGAGLGGADGGGGGGCGGDDGGFAVEWISAPRNIGGRGCQDGQGQGQGGQGQGA